MTPLLQMIVLAVACLLLFVSMLVMIRSHLVFLLSQRLLTEEGIWLNMHRDEMVEGRRQYGLFERYRRLPSYNAMMLMFWKSTGSFEREVGSIEQYYPLLKGMS